MYLASSTSNTVLVHVVLLPHTELSLLTTISSHTNPDQSSDDNLYREIWVQASSANILVV